MYLKASHLICFLIAILVMACNNPGQAPSDCTSDQGKLFSLMPSQVTHIDFRNDLTYTEEFNTYTYRNFYDGGGVAIGDINNDGLQDVFFTGNMVSNRLFLNQGDFIFKDITQECGLNSNGIWSTGVSLADVNGDGLMDIYICKSGRPEGENRHNELFINQGISQDTGYPRFKEMAKEYGIADYGLSTHSAFFDYDKDGDLDMYLLNNSIRSIGNYDLKKDQRLIRDPDGGNKLYRNDGNTFTDISEIAGIYGSAIGFGLDVTIGDINKDGWQDIYISNDFFEKDYLYMNNTDGTFTESLESMIGEISLGSMGADMADINNDAFPELFVTEMLPEQEGRLKTKAIFEDWNKYQANLNAGYYKQFPRNVLQLNRGYANTEQKIYMNEIGRYAGVEATDWSWSALIADLDNDGLKDLFVANGIYKDLIDLDYINFYADPLTTRRIFEERGSFLKQLIDSIPSNSLANYAYKNNGDLTFLNMAEDWGLSCKSFSNGSAYGDLDNDGDLDLVMNNVNMEAFVYRNNSETLAPDNHFLNIQLQGKGLNQGALGAQVTVYSADKMLYQELSPMRGYLSCVDNRLHFGLGNATQIDSLNVQWPDLTSTTLYNLKVDQFLKIEQAQIGNNKSMIKKRKSNTNKLFLSNSLQNSLNYYYKKSTFNNFDRDPLLFQMIADKEANMAVGDVNGDQRDDIYFGGAKGESGQLYIQLANGDFQKSVQKSFEMNRSSTDSGTLLFDADQDGDLDLYVCSGGNEYPSSSASLIDRLYFNDGNGNYSKSSQILPTKIYENTSCVKTADFDKDGDLDLFVGVRAKPFSYGQAGNGYLLLNNGKGTFINANETLAPELQNLGMITDAQWFDFDNDHDEDLIVVGDWMPITIFENQNGKLVKYNPKAGLKISNGFWNTIEVADVDNDGDLDFMAGNQGENTRFEISEDKPMTMYVNDFDENGKTEHIITTYREDNAYPLVGRSELVSQLPYLKKKYLKFDFYKEQTIESIFSTELIENSIKLKVYTGKSSVFINSNDGFQQIPLPTEIQFSPIHAIEIEDFDGDGFLDAVVGGNFYRSKPEMGIYDASKGTMLKGLGNGSFEVMDVEDSGFFVNGEVRDIVKLNIKNQQAIVLSRLNDSIKVFVKGKKK